MPENEKKSLPHIPQRMCVICKRRFSKKQLSRYMVTGAGELLADEQKLLLGRGVYCCADPICQAKLIKYKPKFGKRSRGE